MHGHRQPAPRALRDFGIFETDETWDRWACEIDVEDADGFALQGECQCELQSHGGFADAAFAGEDLCFFISQLAMILRIFI